MVKNVAIGNGQAISSYTNLSIKSEIEGAGAGNVYVYGTFNRFKLSLSNVAVDNPVWNIAANGERSCVASGDFFYNRIPARLLWMWRLSPDTSRTGVAWRVQAYRIGDDPGKPSGAILATNDVNTSTPFGDSNSVTLFGQLWVNIAQPAVNPSV